LRGNGHLLGSQTALASTRYGYEIALFGCVSSLDLIRKISERILLIREEKVILDSDLAEFYGR
jgi:hypothetical protein